MPPQQPPHVARIKLKRCEGTLILARVATEAILSSDLVAGIEEALARNRSKMSPEEKESQRKTYTNEVLQGMADIQACCYDHRRPTQSELKRWFLIKQLLDQQIEVKLICQDARQTIPEEHYPEVEKSLNKQFEEVKLKDLMEQYQVETRAELDRKLRSLGTSLQRAKRAFVKGILAQQWVYQQLDRNEEITHQQIWEYYRQHSAEFDKPAGTSWEQLMVRFSRHPAKEEAYASIVWMGNQVRQGVPFAKVAKAHSDGPTASKGGLRQWPAKSRVSPELEKAILGLPEGELSQILEDWRGYYIIRVIERHPAGRTPFREAQTEIREKIRQQRKREQRQTYASGLAEKIPVWTIFDDLPGAEQLARRKR